MYGELLDFGEGTYGLALNLENDSVGAVVLGDAGQGVCTAGAPVARRFRGEERLPM